MKMSHLLLAVPAAVLLMVAQPRNVEAQCAASCGACTTGGHDGFHGDLNDPGTTYSAACIIGAFCDACEDQNVAGYVETEILKAVAAAPGDELQAVVQRYQDRLLIDEEHHRVVARGGSCDPDAVVAMIFVPAERVVALKKLHVKSLKTHLAARAHTPTLATM